MNVTTSYSPPMKALWQGRKDLPPDSCIFQRIQCLHLQDCHPINTEGLNFAFLGFASDAGVSRNQGRVGASSGPDSIRQALAKLPIKPNIHYVDVGNIHCINDNLEEAQVALAEAINQLLAAQFIPIILGGGHEMAWGHYQGLLSHSQHKSVSIVNFDAHFDMRPILPNQRGSSGTPFLQIAEHLKKIAQDFHYHCIGIQPTSNIALLFETAKHYGVRYLLAEDLQLATSLVEPFMQRILKEKQLYVSICLDVFAASIAPGVSAPQVAGLNPWQIIPWLRKIASSGKVLSYDIAELCPPHDIDNRTAKLAAWLIYEILHHHEPNS